MQQRNYGRESKMRCKWFWCKNGKPDPQEWSTKYLWRPGTIIIEGDSNAWPINPNWISSKATLIAFPGKIPEMCITDFPDVLARHQETPIEKVYIQVGGNDWTWVPLHLWDMNMTVFNNSMVNLIDKYLTILNPKDILVASLPYVYPKLTLTDMLKDQQSDIKVLLPGIKNIICNIRLNDIMYCGNRILIDICREKGVRYFDIYSYLKQMWNDYGRSAWWDEVHYSQFVRSRIAGKIKALWGL